MTKSLTADRAPRYKTANHLEPIVVTNATARQVHISTAVAANRSSLKGPKWKMERMIVPMVRMNVLQVF